MRVVFAGTPEAAVPSLDAVAASSHELVAVVTRPDAPSGRGRRLEASPVRRRAEELGVPVLTPPASRTPSSSTRCGRSPRTRALSWPTATSSRVEALAIPRLGWVNLHFSLLPAWRGAAPVQHALMAGDEVTGASTFVIERGLDTGPVLGVMTETIRLRDTAGDLLDRLSTAGAELLVATLDGLESGQLVAQPQPAEGVSLAPKIEVDDARIAWERPALAVDRLVRGCTPAPGAWTTFRGERLKVAPLELAAPDEVSGHDALSPGTLLVTKKAVYVGTGTVPVRLGQVQAHGKKAMAAADWARGTRIEAGERVGDE